jgi:ubiquinone/menaquinone biosynthesis C-methylase UbiE
LLHHIYSKNDQKKAIEESLRVVKKSGYLVIRESNLKNPLFRIFWNYVFPLTAKIDRFGGENWVSSTFYNEVNFIVAQTCYFTFLPNLTPNWLLPLASRFESYLEKSVFRSLSAHYVVVIKK